MRNYSLLGEAATNRIDHIDLFKYVVLNKKFEMELAEFYVIETGFREMWNSHTGELVGDGDFKNYVYQHILKEVENKVIPTHIPQNTVDKCVDLILEYMSLIGEYNLDFSIS